MIQSAFFMFYSVCSVNPPHKLAKMSNSCAFVVAGWTGCATDRIGPPPSLATPRKERRGSRMSKSIYARDRYNL